MYDRSLDGADVGLVGIEENGHSRNAGKFLQRCAQPQISP